MSDNNVWYTHYIQPDAEPSEWPRSAVEKHGKALACRYLEHYGLTIIGQDQPLTHDGKRHWKTIDIVARDDKGEVVLVDVKASVSYEKGIPELSISYLDMKIMKDTVTRYLEENPEVQLARHDLISIRIVGKTNSRVRHLAGAVEMNRDNLSNG